MINQLPQLLELFDGAADPSRKCGLAVGIIATLRSEVRRLENELRQAEFRLRCAQGAATLAECERDAAQRENENRVVSHGPPSLPSPGIDSVRWTMNEQRSE